MTAFRIVVPVRDAERWVGRCVRSIRFQRGEDWRALVVDDRSEDATHERALEAAAGDPRIEVVRTAERRYALANLVDGVRRLATGPDDVVLAVDGDDWLAHDRVLEVLAGVYADPEVWLTYGSHRRFKDKWTHRVGLRKKRGIAHAFPAEVAEARTFRSQPWAATHLRTFRKFLFDGIRDADLRGPDGSYWRTTWDMALMFPMLEMAGARHIRYVHDMLYVYNNANPRSIHRVAPAEQILNACRSRLMPTYPPHERRR
jgi:glycosyltransferase involved in cell wall biosynthesis